MKQGLLLLIALVIVACNSGQKNEVRYKEYTSPDKSYVVSVPDYIPANKCFADLMSFVKDDNFIIIQRISAEHLSDDVTNIINESGKFSFSQIEVSDTTIMYQASKGLIMAYKYYLIKKLPEANYMISVSSFTKSKNEIKEMGNKIYASLKPFQQADVETKDQNVSLKADKSYATSYYTIKYPKHWQVQEHIDEMTEVYIGYQPENFGFTIVRFETDYSLAEVNAEGNKNVRQAGFRILEEKQMKVDGVKCYKTIQEIAIQGQKVKHISYTFKKGDMLYNIKFGSVTTRTQESLASDIIDSFHFK